MVGSRINVKDVYDAETKIISMPPIYNVVEKSLGVHVFEMMKKNKRKIAQYMVDTGKPDTYASMLKRCIRTALELKTRDLSKDDVVCLCTTNHIDSCVPFIAALFLGLPSASLDPSMAVADVTHLVSQVRPKIFFIVPKMLPIIQEALESSELEAEIVVFGKTEDKTNFEDFLSEKEAENEFEPVEVEDLNETAVILFSSGTTGLPKGIMLSHRSLLGQTITLVDCGLFVKVSLSYSTLYWISAVLFLFASIFTGTAKVVCSSFDPNQLWKMIEKYKVTLVFLAPAQATMMLHVGRPDDLDTTEFLYLLTGGAVFNQTQLEQLRDLLPGTAVFQAYGQTETAGMLTLFKADTVEDNQLVYRRPSSCGRPVPNMMYRIVDCDTEEPCGFNQEGELRVKSPFLMNGYYKIDSSSAFDSDGWLRTGDVAYYDEELCFYVVDRIKEMLKFRSWHVPPAVVEGVLNNHPAVIQSVVIGIPHETDGDHPMALVQVDPASSVTPEELEHYVQDRVDDRQRLRAGVKFVANIAMTPSGKFKRRYIREMVLKGMI